MSKKRKPIARPRQFDYKGCLYFVLFSIFVLVFSVLIVMAIDHGMSTFYERNPDAQCYAEFKSFYCTTDNEDE